MEIEAILFLRQFIASSLLLEALLSGWALSCNRPSKEPPAVTINKQPVNFARRTFDPANPPSDMPPLAQEENAACVSDFISNATVAGQSRQTDATHATIPVTHIKMDLQLNLSIWVPIETTARGTEHEEGHRQIAEYYYQAAVEVAE